MIWKRHIVAYGLCLVAFVVTWCGYLMGRKPVDQASMVSYHLLPLSEWGVGTLTGKQRDGIKDGRYFSDPGGYTGYAINADYGYRTKYVFFCKDKMYPERSGLQ
jgi:hypothetical protein